MPQLPIISAASPQPGAGISQASAAAASAVEGGSGLEGAPGLGFGVVLTRQMKEIALQLGQERDAGRSLGATDESAEPAANAGAAALPVDLSALTASMLAPAPPIQAGGGAGTLAEAGAERPLMQLPKTGEAKLAAEIAANGKNSPQAAPPERLFADKLAALAEAPAGNGDGGGGSLGLPVAVNYSAVVAASRNQEPLPALPVAPRVGSTDWGGAVGEKVVWMAGQGHQVAELHLNPPNLGPLEVRLTIGNDQASALFVSHHSAVREAIETALPRLREMLADNGIMLGNVTVGSESFGQQQASGQGNGKEGNRGGLGTEGVMNRTVAPGRLVGLVHDGMVDIFA